MQMAEEWLKTWICLSFLFAWVRAARPRFDVSTDMGMVLVPADAEVDTAIFRLRATDQDTDFPLIFEIIATTSPIVRIENLPCTLYNKVCQANVILTRRLVAGRLHDFVVRVKDSKGDVNSMQATISVTNSTTPRDKIFPHLPSLIMVPEDTKPEKELDYLLVESNPWSGKPVYIELWQPKELFKIRQRQMGSQTKGIITLIGELDFETQSMYTLTMYATDPYTEPGKDTRNIAGLHVVVIVQDVQDVPPVFTLAPPLTKISNSIKPGDLILRVHAEDGDKGVPRDVTYGLISEGNPFTPFFNVSETTGEIVLAKPLEELTKIIHVGAPIVLKIVAEEIRSMRDEPPAQATIVELGLLLGEPGNSPPYFENDNYVAWMNENSEPGTIIIFTDDYSTRVKDEDIGKAGVFALKLENNNGTFEISPAVAERNANFVITVRDNALIDYEKFRSLCFKIIAQEVGPATNLSTSVPVMIFLRDINDNLPIFDNPIYNVTLAENSNAGTKVVQVHATDTDAGILGKIQYTKIIGDGHEAFEMYPDNGLVTVSMGSILDREQTPRLELIIEARDEDGRGLRGTTTLIINILDVNDNAPIFEKGIYEFLMNAELTNFTTPTFIKALDLDAEPPNNLVQYEIVHGNYENKFQLNEKTGELMVRETTNKSRKVRGNYNRNLTLNMRKQFKKYNDTETLGIRMLNSTSELNFRKFHSLTNLTQEDLELQNQNRSRRAENNPLFILTVRAYDLGVPHLSNLAQIRIMRPMLTFARIVMFVMPGENPDPRKTAETLATITGSRVTIQEIKPYISQINAGISSDVGKRSVVVARVEQNGPGTLVDVDKIRASLTENGFGIISGMDNAGDNIANAATNINFNTSNIGRNNSKNISAINSNADVTTYKAENKLLTWLLIILGLLLLAAIITLIICCICPSCPFYMEPRKRQIHSSETLVIHSDSRPKRHLHRKPIKVTDAYYGERKEAWSADPGRQHWQFNRRNTKNLGISSLPGDVIPGHQNPEVERLRRVTSLHLRDDNIRDTGAIGEQMLVRSHVTNLNPQNERIYVEDVEAQNRSFERPELDSIRKHELERGSDGIPRNEATLPGLENSREQHFYRDGNVEVLRLITRGEIEDQRNFGDGTKEFHHLNGKDILLQRFIEDQKLRRSQDLRDSFQESFHEADIARSMESHQRPNEFTEILILPEKLEIQRQPVYNQRQHEQMLNAEIQRLMIDRNYKSKDFKDGEGDEYRKRGVLKVSMRDAELATGEMVKDAENASYVMHDVELVRQNALLTRLLLEKETRGLNVPMVDSSSFLETQSLPGHVAIATQTDRTTATQTEFFGRSRSDNEEIEEDQRIRRKSKLKERLEIKEDFKKLKTIWVRTPIPEESRTLSGNKTSTPTRTKIEVTESCKVSISPDVLKEVSSSLKSSESGGNEEEEDEEVLVKRAKLKADIMQKAHKLTSKAICENKKKAKESKADNDSTTASPEIKKKNTSIKSKICKKPEISRQVKKMEKSIESEKSHFMEPSFRVLEREISNFHQKIREFGDKKLKLIKSDTDKKDKASNLDSGMAYDMSKRCEISVQKTKHSISKENSPTKISVEQKAKSSEEESISKDQNITKQQMQNNSSSNFEDFDKSSKPSLNATEKIISISTTQRRSRSKLRRQTHLGDSDPRSESEKIEKSEDSESKMDKSKDFTACSLKDFSKQQKPIENQKLQKPQMQERRNMRSQKLSTKLRPTGIVDTKRKVSSLESKNMEESKKKIVKRDDKLDVNKILTSDDNKSTSSTKSKINTSHKKPAIDIDKLVQEVKGAVEKEISSFTQAAKVTSNGKKSNQSITDNMEKKLRSPLKSKETQQIESTLTKKYPEIIILQNPEYDKILKSTNIKDNREKLKENTLATKLKCNDEISFIIIDKNKMVDSSNKLQSKDLDGVIQDLKNVETLDQHINQDYGKIEIKENIEDKNDATILHTNSKEFCEKIHESKNIISRNIHNTEKIDKSQEIISDKTEESMKTKLDEINKDASIVSDQIYDAKQNVLGSIDETEKTVFNKISDTKKMITDKFDQTKNIISDSTVKTEKTVSNKIDETKKIISHKINNIEAIISDEFNESKKTISDIIDNTEKIFTNECDKTKNIISDKTDDRIKIVTDTIYGNEKIMSSIVNDSQISTDKIHEIEKIVSDKTDNLEKTIIAKADEIKQYESNEYNSTKTTEKSKMDKTQIIVSNLINDIKNNDMDKTNISGKNISDKINMTEKSINESKAIKSDNIKIKENPCDNFRENEMVTVNKNEESNLKIKKEISKNNRKQVSLEEKDQLLPFEITKILGMDVKSKENDTITDAVVSTVHLLDKTVKENQDLEEIENANLKQDILKSKSIYIPSEIKDLNEKISNENSIEINSNKIDTEIKDILSEMDKNERNEISPSTYYVNDINNEILEIDNVKQNPLHKEEICKKKSITLLNGSFKEKEGTGTIQMKQPTEYVQKIHEKSLNNENYIFSSNLNNDKKALSVEITHLKEMEESEIHKKQETDKEKFIPNVSDKTQEISMESSQLKQVNGQVNTVDIIGVNDENKNKSLVEKNERKSNSLSIENKETQSSMKAFSYQIDDSKKEIFELTNAINSIKLDDQESDNDSSSATDISNKTALRTKPYGTPRHSISLDKIGDTSAPKLEKTLSNVTMNGKVRQKWSSEREKDPVLRVAVQQPRDTSITGFSQKMETSPLDKPKISANKATFDQTKMQKSPTKESHTASTMLKSTENIEDKMSYSKQRTDASRTQPVIVGLKKKDHLRKMSPEQEKSTKIEDKKSQHQNQSESRERSKIEQRRVEIRSRHLKLHVSHRPWQSKNDFCGFEERCTARDYSSLQSPIRDFKDDGTPRSIEHCRDPEIANARSRYMAWYQEKRAEMERKRRERKDAEKEQQSRSRWLNPKLGAKSRKAKSAEDIEQRENITKRGRRSRERAKSSSDAGQSLTSIFGRSSLGRVRIRPLVNVESEQLKAIVRQGRKLRKAEGAKEDPEVQIFVPEKPSKLQVDPLPSMIQLEPRHHLTQHSEYKYEKEIPAMPFYLHPPPVPHSSPEHHQDESSETRRLDDDLDSRVAVSMQNGTRLRHQQLLEKKSVFDIAYSEAAPTQLRSDSSTPPT